MILLYVLVAAYIAAVNFFTFRLVKLEREEWASGDDKYNSHDGKILLACIMGGSIGAFVTMVVNKFRITNLLFMILLPLLSVINLYGFYLAFRYLTLMVF